ncbi:hypothetical protein ABIC60_004856 [Phyllobacterium ifriqiyense]
MIANPNFGRSWKFDSNGVLRVGARMSGWQAVNHGKFTAEPCLVVIAPCQVSRPDAIGKCLSVVSRPGCKRPLDLPVTAQSAPVPVTCFALASELLYKDKRR